MSAYALVVLLTACLSLPESTDQYDSTRGRDTDVQTDSTISTGTDGCQKISGRYQYLGNYEWSGAPKVRRVSIYHASGHVPAKGAVLPKAEWFELAVGDGKFLFTIYGKEDVVDKFSIDAGCSNGDWVVKYNVSGYADGTSSTADYTDVYTISPRGALVVKSHVSGRSTSILPHSFNEETITTFEKK